MKSENDFSVEGLAKLANLANYVLETAEAEPVHHLDRNVERRILAWLEHIEETGPEIVAEVLNKCRHDAEARRYFLRRAEEVPEYDPHRLDRECGLLWCQECRYFRGYQSCANGYAPTKKTEWRRCEDYNSEI